MGDVKSKPDSTGVLDVYTYDNQGRQLSYTQKRQDGTEAITTYSRYDKNGNKKFEIDGNGNKKENTYNEDNKLISTRISGSSNLQPFSNGDLAGRDASFALSGNI